MPRCLYKQLDGNEPEVFLHERWLVKPQNHCNGFALAAIASLLAETMFVSSVIIKVHEPNIVETQDGTIVAFRGFINPSYIPKCFFFRGRVPFISVEVVYNDENNVSVFYELNVSFPKKKVDVTSHGAKEAEDDDNIGSLRMSQPEVDVINTGEMEFQVLLQLEVSNLRWVCLNLIYTWSKAVSSLHFTQRN
ncbi:hypothetical protein RYX36_003153 [Vicia faba]